MCPTSVREQSPVRVFHTFAVPSQEPVTTAQPLGEKQTERMVSSCPVSCSMLPQPSSRHVVRDSVQPPSRCHSPTIWSSEPVARRPLSWLNATARTVSLCPCRTRCCTPVCAFHTTAVRSAEPVAIMQPSKENATDQMLIPCAAMASSCEPLWTSQTRSVPSSRPAATLELLGECTTDHTEHPWPVSARSMVPSSMLHNSRMPFQAAMAMVWPLGAQEVATISLVSTKKLDTHSFSATLHVLMLWSMLPVARESPSGEKADE
mmetsp:Transcript_36392/g.108736  ORF Transcript_36392/g.108736 Transcript_36392/m.108736 type:complete len:262 (-) Transcript_36392:195-980(-)